MSESLNYDALCYYAGGYLDGRIPEPIAIGHGDPVPDVPVAVYIAVGVTGAVLYVGSVVRPKDSAGAGSRLGEHLRNHAKFASWNQLYLIPLKSSTPVEEVRRIEGRIGAHLRPRMSRALPRLRKRS